jgi:hypothetical protein
VLCNIAWERFQINNHASCLQTGELVWELNVLPHYLIVTMWQYWPLFPPDRF